ncbi:MAG: HEAT repeat domain-containing protein [Anaerolineaceae bacterium]|nr:HEAT repeat domain-containing protein [Anaerolineaceae bacterium]
MRLDDEQHKNTFFSGCFAIILTSIFSYSLWFQNYWAALGASILFSIVLGVFWKIYIDYFYHALINSLILAIIIGIGTFSSEILSNFVESNWQNLVLIGIGSLLVLIFSRKQISMKFTQIKEKKLLDYLNLPKEAQSIKVLIKILKYDRRYCFEKQPYQIRERAARRLGEIGDVRAVKPLIKSISDNHHHVREMAAQSLGMIGDTRAIKPLVSTLANGKGSVLRSKAQHALEKLNWNPEEDETGHNNKN